jgi:hypothetical protein
MKLVYIVIFVISAIAIAATTIKYEKHITRDTLRVPLNDSATVVRTTTKMAKNEYLDTVKLLFSDSIIVPVKYDTLKPKAKKAK